MSALFLLLILGGAPPAPLPPPDSSPAGAYQRSGTGEDPRIDPSRSDFAPTTRQGTIARVSRGQLQLRQTDGQVLELSVGREARVTRAGQRLSWRDLRQGSSVRASYYFLGTHRIVDRVEVLPAPAR